MSIDVQGGLNQRQSDLVVDTSKGLFQFRSPLDDRCLQPSPFVHDSTLLPWITMTWMTENDLRDKLINTLVLKNMSKWIGEVPCVQV